MLQAGYIILVAVAVFVVPSITLLAVYGSGSFGGGFGGSDSGDNIILTGIP